MDWGKQYETKTKYHHDDCSGSFLVRAHVGFESGTKR